MKKAIGVIISVLLLSLVGLSQTFAMTDNKDGTLTDEATGLMWKKNPNGSGDFSSVATYISQLNFGKYNDWRLPTSAELTALPYFFNFNWHYWYEDSKVIQNNMRSAIMVEKVGDSEYNQYVEFVPSTDWAYILAVRGPISTPENPSLPSLSEGWNLVGIKGDSSISADSIGAVASIWKWTAVDGVKTWAVYIPGAEDKGASYAASKGFSLFTTINPGEGFWVNSTTDLPLP